jgi:hypothetical protein
MMWTLLIVTLSGGIVSTSASTQAIPMQSKEACTRAAKEFADTSAGPIGFLCISSETGEIIRFKPTK